MLNKKGQFYFVAIIILAAVFVGFVTYSNKIHYDDAPIFLQYGKSINTESSYLFDYFSRNQISYGAMNSTLTNFSLDYINETGTDKDAFFFFGDSSSLILVANKLPTTSLSINTGLGNSNVSDNGTFEKEYTLSGSNLTVSVDNVEYNFTFYSGENFYYIMRYKDGGQNFIITG